MTSPVGGGSGSPKGTEGGKGVQKFGNFVDVICVCPLTSAEPHYKVGPKVRDATPRVRTGPPCVVHPQDGGRSRGQCKFLRAFHCARVGV